MKIYLDLDRTLFNTDLFLEDLYHLLKDDIDLNEFQKIQHDEKEDGFNPYKILKRMHAPLETLNKVDNFMKEVAKYVYRDVFPFIKDLHQKGYWVILLTKGDKRFQKMKIKYCHLKDCFDEEIFTLNYKGTLPLNYSNSIFIDDNPYELDDIYLNHPKRIIRIKRENAKYNEIITKYSIEEITNFEELVI